MYQSKSERGLQIKYTELQRESTRGMVFKGHGKRSALNGSVGAISGSPAVALVGGDSRDDYAKSCQCRCYPRDNIRVVGWPYEWPRSELLLFVSTRLGAYTDHSERRGSQHSEKCDIDR